MNQLILISISNHYYLLSYHQSDSRSSGCLITWRLHTEVSLSVWQLVRLGLPICPTLLLSVSQCRGGFWIVNSPTRRHIWVTLPRKTITQVSCNVLSSSCTGWHCSAIIQPYCAGITAWESLLRVNYKLRQKERSIFLIHSLHSIISY